MIAAVPPGEDLSQYDVVVTGHSLGGSLATSFTLDIAEYGMDAGRGLPQLKPSEAWWSSLASSFGKKQYRSTAASPEAKVLENVQLWQPKGRQRCLLRKV